MNVGSMGENTQLKLLREEPIIFDEVAFLGGLRHLDLEVPLGA
jgi:hypothetical protein